MSISRRDLIKLGGAAAAGMVVAGAPTRMASAEKQKAAAPISLSGNENPYGPSAEVRQALHDAVDTANRYGYSRQKELVRQIAAKEGVTPEHIVLGAGSTEVINASILAFAGSDGQVITVDQGYSAIPSFTTGISAELILVPIGDDLRYDLDALHDRTTKDTGLVYVCNPNNPTGTVVDSGKLRDFCLSLPKETIVLADEAYLEFTDHFDRDSMVDLVKQDHNVVVTRTFSKIHGLAGMRIGYSIASPELSRQITAHKMCKFMGPLASVAASISLDQTGFHNFCRGIAKQGRQLVFDLCDELGLEYADGTANFIFLNPKMSNEEFKRRMLTRGIESARPFPPRLGWSRITMGTTEEMQAFAAVLPEVIAS